MNVENILKLAEMLESPAAEKHFSMETWIDHNGDHDLDPNSVPIQEAMNDCGTTACLAGWCALLAAPSKVFRTDEEIRDTAEAFLGIDSMLGSMLFVPYGYLNETDPKAAAKVVRHLAETGEVDWGLADY